MSRERALITGASSGIGLELARLFAKDSKDLVIIARSEDKLNELASELNEKHGVDVKVIVKDLSNIEAPREIFDELSNKNLEIDYLVNNAGFGAVGPFSELDYDRQVNMVNLNVTSLVALSRLFLPGFIEKNSGGVLNVGSLAGFQAGPNAAIYYATKAFVLSFTEALSSELKNTNVKVSCLAPGPVATGFGEESGMDDALLFKTIVMNVNDVVDTAYKEFMNGKTVIIPGLMNKFLPQLSRVFPRKVVREIAGKLNKT